MDDGPVAALLDRARRRPLVVIDPRWPASQRLAADTAVAAAVDQERIGPDDLVLFTSGSTAGPRGVVRTIDSWRASLQPLSEVTGIGAGDVVWVPGPLSSSLSLYGAFHAGAVGAVAVCDPSVEAARTATAAHLVPTSLHDAVDAAHLLPQLRTVVVAGDVLPEPLRDKASGLGWRVVEYYGAAELSFVGMRDSPGPMRDFPGAEVQVRGQQLWVRSPYCCRGYLSPSDDGPLLRDDDWASVGDLGRREGSGWVILGRGDAVVVTGGVTVIAEEVEAVLAGVEGVTAVAVVGLPHDRLGQYVVAVVVADRPVRDALLRACAALPAPSRPRRWLAADRLPLTPAGKLARADVADAALGLAPLR